jgi:GTP-binding protein EngB required for normal cell division
VFTKTDKSPAAHVQQNIESFKEHMSEWFETLPEMFRCSSVSGHGLPELHGVIHEMLASV